MAASQCLFMLDASLHRHRALLGEATTTGFVAFVLGAYISSRRNAHDGASATTVETTGVRADATHPFEEGKPLSGACSAATEKRKRIDIVRQDTPNANSDSRSTTPKTGNTGTQTE